MDARVRQAMNHGADLQAIIRSVYNGQAQRVNSLIGNVQFGHDPTLPPMAYDVAKAKQLLAEAGVPNGFKIGTGVPERGVRQRQGSLPGHRRLPRQARDRGRPPDHGVEPLLGPRGEEAAPAALLRRGRRPACRIRRPSSGSRPRPRYFTAFEKKEFTELIDQAGSTVDQEQRKRLYAKLARDMQADPPFLFLWQVRRTSRACGSASRVTRRGRPRTWATSPSTWASNSSRPRRPPDDRPGARGTLVGARGARP